MAVRLTIRETSTSSTEYVRSFVQDRIVIGRARSCDICLPDLAVSQRHAEIRLQKQEYVLVDLSSVNGTLASGKPLVAHRPHKLHSGDELAIAGFRLVFFHGVAATAAETRDTAASHARDMLGRILARSSASLPTALLIIDGPGAGTRYELPYPSGVLVIGRGRECQVVLEDTDASRRHAELGVDQNGIRVRDLNSRNGCFVDGERAKERALTPGMELRIGKTFFALENPVLHRLQAILEAPEDETSSYTATTAEEPGAAGSNEPGGEPATAAPPLRPSRSDLPVGPTDPLAEAAAARDSKPQPLVAEPPAPFSVGTDLGLIIIGALLVLAAVAGLVYLFS